MKAGSTAIEAVITFSDADGLASPEAALGIPSRAHGFDRLEQSLPNPHDADVANREKILVEPVDPRTHAVDHRVILDPRGDGDRVAELGMGRSSSQVLLVGRRANAK